MKNQNFSEITKRRRDFGMTILEVVIASALFTMLSLGILLTVIFGMRVHKADMKEMEFAQMARRFVSDIEEEVKLSQLILVSADGNKLRLRINESGTNRVAVFEYKDDDDNPATIGDNYITYDSIESDDNPGEVILKYVTPVEDNDIFTYPDATHPLDITLRVGDNQSDSGAPCHSISGPGVQKVIIRHSIVPRN